MADTVLTVFDEGNNTRLILSNKMLGSENHLESTVELYLHH